MLELAQLFLLLSASALCIFLIFYFKRITQSIFDIKIELQKIADQLNPVLNSIQNLSKSITELTDGVKNQIEKTNWIIDEIKERVSIILNFEKKIRSELERPIDNLLSNLNALKKGISVFWEKIRR